MLYSILLEKLKIFSDELIQRNQIVKQYKSILDSKVIFQKIDINFTSSFAQLAIVFSNSTQKKQIIKKLKANNIPIGEFYKIPLHFQKVNVIFSASESAFRALSNAL